MKLDVQMIILLVCLSFLGDPGKSCSTATVTDGHGPQRVVIITGKATIINFPNGPLPATSETLIFQKAGCETCYVAAKVDDDGQYKILVGDGKYKIIVRNPSSPEVDWLAPDQERYIDTGSENSPNSLFRFDIKIKMPN